MPRMPLTPDDLNAVSCHLIDLRDEILTTIHGRQCGIVENGYGTPAVIVEAVLQLQRVADDNARRISATIRSIEPRC